MKHTKFITIGMLPIMWIIYFVFELLTGRITTLTSFIFNSMLILLFALAGYFIYLLSRKYLLGFSNIIIFLLFLSTLLLDQCVKFVIKLFFFNSHINIIGDMLTFSPIINSQGSWLNARFNTSISFSILIFINIIALFLLFELFRYFLNKGFKSFWSDLSFVFLFSGALCSLIDKIFYGGSLDFIGITNLFVADIKDIYINLGLYFFIICTYSSGYLTSDDTSSFKDDINSIKSFLSFAIKDLLSIIKKH